MAAVQFGIKTLTDKAVYRGHATFISDVRLLAMSLGLRALRQQRGRDRGRWVGFRLSLGSMAASGLGVEKLLVGAGWAFSLLLCTNGLRKQFSRSRQAMVSREP